MKRELSEGIALVEPAKPALAVDLLALELTGQPVAVEDGLGK
jgi:hypothetical protein